MRIRTNAFVRHPTRWALVPAIAAIGVFAGLNSASALGQQASEEAVENASSWEVVGSHRSGPFAQGGTIYAPGHRIYRHRVSR